MCRNRNWNSSRLLLALPDDLDRTKSAVTSFTYDAGALRYGALTNWVQEVVGRRVKRIQGKSELIAWTNDCKSMANVCLLLVSSLTLPPFFLSALSVRFTGRVKFALSGYRQYKAAVAAGAMVEDPAGDVDEENASGGSDSRRRTPVNGARKTPIGRYYIISAADGQSVRYGGPGGRDEPLTYWALNRWLNWFAPDANDLFVLSVALANLLALLTLFECRGQPWQLFAVFVWKAFVYNLTVLLIWGAAVSLMNQRSFSAVFAALSSSVRRFSGSEWGRAVASHLTLIRPVDEDSGRQSWLWPMTNLMCSFLGFNGLLYYLRRRFWPQSLHELPEAVFDWSSGFLAPTDFAAGLRFATLTPATLWGTVSRSVSPSSRGVFRLELSSAGDAELAGFDERLVKLIQRLSIKEVCVYPGRPYDYVLGLPTGNFRSSEHKCSGDGQSCPICLDNFQLEDVVCWLSCEHRFHHRCIVAWLLRDQPTCPCCRQPADSVLDHQPAY